MLRRSLTVTSCLLLACTIAAEAAEHKLDQLREDVHPTHTSTDAPHHDDDRDREHSHASVDDELSSAAGEFLAEAALIAAAAIYITPVLLLDDAWEPGWDITQPHQPQRLPPRVFAVDAWAAYQDDGDGVTHEWGRARVDSTSRFGATLTLDHLREDGDQLMLGSADLSVRFAQGHGWEFHGGLGGQWLHDANYADGGIHLAYGAQWWPVAPLVLRAELTTGRLGESGTGEAWGQAGLAWRWGEVFAGGRYQRIGSVEFAGPMLGVAAHW
jgi:hypothetical protein